MRRGFKTEATALARDVRAELGLSAVDRLDPIRLADHLAIPVVALSTIEEDAPAAVDYFLRIDGSCFSGLTVFAGAHRLIVFNDGHAPTRQVSDITHELAHGLLLHPPLPALDHRGFRYHDPEREDEASFLAGALLVTEEAAIRTVQQGNGLAEASARLGVSDDMLRWRINITGAQKRVARSARRCQ